DRRQLGGVHGVAGGEHRVIVGHVDLTTEGGHSVLLGEFDGQLFGAGAVQVQADDGPAVPGEAVGSGAADPALGADPGDDDGALRVAGQGVSPLKWSAAGGGAEPGWIWWTPCSGGTG